VKPGLSEEKHITWWFFGGFWLMPQFAGSKDIDSS
jgi:hypothetical protein